MFRWFSLVGHVTAEDPRTHLLLGKLAIQLDDKHLLREAKEFLTLLKQDWAIEELTTAEKTSSRATSRARRDSPLLAARVITMRNISKATEIARCRLYWEYARSAVYW